jgi:hypothetical protein
MGHLRQLARFSEGGVDVVAPTLLLCSTTNKRPPYRLITR